MRGCVPVSSTDADDDDGRERAAQRTRLALYLDLVRWDRPAGWLLLLWPTLSALWIAADGFPGWHLLAVFVLGTILMRSAGCCVNDVADRDFDRHVKRTAQRPVTSGAVSVREALALGAVLALLAFALVLTTNAADDRCCRSRRSRSRSPIRTPSASCRCRRRCSASRSASASRWRSPRCSGCGAARSAWALLVGNLFWVLAYDTEYAMVDRDDDLSIGSRRRRSRSAAATCSA